MNDDYSELLYHTFGELIEQYSDADFPAIEIDSHIRVVGDSRTWRIAREMDQLVLLEWRGGGPNQWPGHEYAYVWYHKSRLRFD